jgi:phosphate transport system substrate-binding protein
MQSVSIIRSLTVSVVIAVLSSSAVLAKDVESPTILRVVGSTTVEKSLLEPNREHIRAATDVELELKCKGTGAGLLKLANGLAEVSGSSEPLADAIKSANESAKEEHDQTKLPNNLVYSEIGHDRIVIIVNAKNKAITKLSKQQIADIFTQKIVNWKQVGGKDESITVFISPVGSATRSLFQKIILDGAEFPSEEVHKGGIMMPVSSTAREVDNVAMISDSISAVSESTVNVSVRKSEVRIVETPSIERPLGLITVGNPSAKVQKVINYLRSNERAKVVVSKNN